LRAVVHDTPRPMQRAGSLAPIVSALLAKDPAARPAEEDLPRLFDDAAAGTTAPTIADDSRAAPLLIPAIEGAPTSAEPSPATTAIAAEAPPRRRSWIVAGAIATAIAIAAVIGMAFGGNAQAPAKRGKQATVADHSSTR